MSNNLTAVEVATMICGADRSDTKIDDVCREKVAAAYEGHAAGLSEIELDRFDVLTRNVLTGYKRNNIFAKKAMSQAIGECLVENKLPNVLGDGQFKVLEDCATSKMRETGIDQITGSLELFGVSRSFSETFDHIHAVSVSDSANDYAKRMALESLMDQAFGMMGDKAGPEERTAVASSIASQVEGMKAFQIAAQMVAGVSDDGVELTQVPSELLRPIVQELHNWNRNGHIYDADVVGVIAVCAELYREALVKRPEGMSPIEVASRIGNEVREILVNGKGVEYGTEREKSDKAMTRGRFVRHLKVVRFDRKGNPVFKARR